MPGRMKQNSFAAFVVRELFVVVGQSAMPRIVAGSDWLQEDNIFSINKFKIHAQLFLIKKYCSLLFSALTTNTNNKALH